MIDLVTFLDELRAQLNTSRIRAQTAAQGGDGVLLAINKTTVELSVVATQEAGVNGKVKFSVLGLGAELGGAGKDATQSVQKLTLDLEPVDAATGKTLLVSKSGSAVPEADTDEDARRGVPDPS